MNSKYTTRLSIKNKALLISICLLSALWHSRQQYSMTTSSGEEPSVLIYAEESAVVSNQSGTETKLELHYSKAKQKACTTTREDQEGTGRETHPQAK